MATAGIAEQQVAEKAGGGAVREHAIGTHGSAGDGSGGYGPGGGWGVADRPRQAAAHGDMSSLRVSAPWFDETGGESSWLPGLTPVTVAGPRRIRTGFLSCRRIGGGSPPCPRKGRQLAVDLRG
ncbi:hypothetical protein GCM10010478_59320 [Streptomyces erythrogriseus]|uniref:Uncharacterized protein n=2 Tax=Streptomyces griseoincarnatus group TaxID=2867193 RepID=A0ABN3XDR0_9ACTN|nr:hypothetical protein GCM10010265_53270 [Streptomyces griseoincarnatus]GGT76493.1 hypothetical protein GCM10010287_58520 [Streptomyces variabilis]